MHGYISPISAMAGSARCEPLPTGRRSRHWGRGGSSFMDLTGDGVLDLVDFAPSNPGFFERKPDTAWAGFRPFHALPVQDWTDPNLRFVDLTGDGIADILVTEDDAFTWHQSLLAGGFARGAPRPVAARRGARARASSLPTTRNRSISPT